MRWKFLTFGGGLPNWRAAARRLAIQAGSSGWFDEIVCLTDTDLRRRYPTFVAAHEKLLSPRVRGFGYWIWKPFLISEVLGQSARHQGVVYLDAGCELNVSVESSARMRDYQDMALSTSSGLGLQHIPDNTDLMWTKADTRVSLGLADGLAARPQVMATVVVAANRANTRDLVDEWLSAGSVDSYHLLDDSPSFRPEAAQFQEHRHDQSILSCLAKSAGVPTIPDETFWAPDWDTAGAQYPIWALRNRSRASVQSQEFSSHAVRFAEKAYSRVYRSLLGRRRT